jgi:hypothetical protein
VEAREGYADYRTPGGFVEDHLALDSLTLARFDAISPDKAKRSLARHRSVAGVAQQSRPALR